MAMLGGVYLDVVYSEKPERSVKTTDHPVESGQPLVDHVERQPYVLNLTGLITGSDAAARLKKIENLQDSGTPVTYVHRNGVSNVIIETFNTVHDSSTAGGFSFTMSLKKIRVALATPVQAMKLPTASQVKAVANKGQQQKAKPSQQKKAAAKKSNKKTPAQLAAENGNHVKGR